MAQSVVSLPLDKLRIGPRLRAIDADYVALLAASMAETGQHTPIHVGPADDEGLHPLITGAHRCAAARQAGLTQILALVFEGSALEQRMLEIDENLMRRELSELDRAVFLAERKALYEALHPETAHGGDRRGRGAGDQVDKNGHLILPPRFTAATAERIGLSERSIRRILGRAAITDAARQALAGTRWADHGASLDAIAKLPPEQQLPVVSTLLAHEQAGATCSVAGAIAQVQGVVPRIAASPREEEEKRLQTAWRKASKEAREWFFYWLLSQDSTRLQLIAAVEKVRAQEEGRVLGALNKGRAA
jgi:ParB family chromosome partitioning protein